MRSTVSLERYVREFCSGEQAGLSFRKLQAVATKSQKLSYNAANIFVARFSDKHWNTLVHHRITINDSTAQGEIWIFDEDTRLWKRKWQSFRTDCDTRYRIDDAGR